MPTNTMNVSLDTSVTPYRLDVTDNGGQNQVSQSPNPQTITWNLTGVLTQGNFVAMSATQPGFEWVQAPPAGIFGTPTVGSNGNSMSITDTHTSASTNGQWIYMLRVSYNGTVYSTVANLLTGTSTNPIIINH
jgi:hypothetical protein